MLVDGILTDSGDLTKDLQFLFFRYNFITNCMFMIALQMLEKSKTCCICNKFIYRLYTILLCEYENSYTF